MSRFPGVGSRIQARLKALGFRKNGRLDILRFCQQHGYRPQYLYAWLRDRLPAYENLVRLARDLEVSPEWLMFGAGPSRPLREAADTARGGRSAQIIDFARLREVTSRLVRLETELEAIFRAFPDLYFWLDADLTFLAYEAGQGSSFHVLPESVVGSPLATAFPAEIGPTLARAAGQTLSTTAASSVEFSLPSGATDGHEPLVRSYEARFLPLADRPPARPRVLMIVRDITERRRAEDATRALVAAGRELASTLDAAQATERVVSTVLGIFRVRGAALFRVDAADGALVCAAVAGVREPARWIGQRLPPGTGVSGLAAAEKRLAASSDVSRDPRVRMPDWLRRLSADAGHGAVASVPLVSREEILGTLALADAPGRVFTDAELELLSGFADEAALALQNARLFEDAERRRREAEVIADLGRTINASLDLQDVLPTVVEGARELCGSDVATIALREPAGDTLAMRYAAGSAASLSALVVEPGKGIGGRVLVTGEPFRTDDYASDTRFTKEYLPALLADGVVTGLVVPVPIDGRVEGLLYVHNRSPRPFTEQDQSVLQRLAGHAAIALRNARVYQRSEHRRLAAESLADVGRLVSRSLDPEVVAQRIADSVRELFQANASALVRLEPETGEGVTVAVSGDTGPGIFTPSVPPGGLGVATLAMRTRRVVASADARADARIRSASADSRAALAAPLLVHDQSVGALLVEGPTGRRFDDEDTRLFQAFADQASLALENARLFRAAERATARAQAAADRSEQRFASLVRGLTGIAWEAETAPWRTLSISPAVEAVLGYPLERWREESDFWLTHLHPDDRERFVRARDASELPPGDQELEYRMVAADGRVVWFSDLVHASADETTGSRRLHGVMVDITESKLATAAARAFGEIGRLHVTSFDGHVVSQEIAESVRRLLGARIAAVARCQAGPAGATVVAQASAQPALLALGELLSPDTGLAALALRERRTTCSSDVLADPRIGAPRRDVGGSDDARTCALLVVPLAARGEVFGVLAIGDIAGRTFDIREIRLAEAFADYAAIALTGSRAGSERPARERS